MQKYWAKTILLNQPACFDFSSSNFLLQGHILSTGEAALMPQTEEEEEEEET
jgi:hypothetical protein